jgi:16S rRNA C967 or C1407 C5-methylase (RsmB/RsmF family)
MNRLGTVLAGGMIRCEAKRDKTNGFFVCLFTRTP